MSLRQSLGLLLVCWLATIAAAQTTYTWTGAAQDFVFATPGNWQGNVAPTGNPTDNILFPNLPVAPEEEYLLNASVNAPIALGNITFGGSYYSFSLLGTGPITLHGNIAASGSVGNIGTPVILAAGNHSFTGPNYVFQTGDVSGTGSLTVNSGTLALFGTGNSYSGGTTINGGTVITSSSTAFGAGPVTLSSGTITLSGSNYTLGYNFLLGSSVTLSSYSTNGSTQFGSAATTLAPIAAGATTVSIDVGYGTGPVVIGGGLVNGSGATTYAFTDNEGVGNILGSYFRLDGTNTYTGGTSVNAGAVLIFGTASAIPTTGLITAASDAYVGIENPALLATLLGKLDSATFAGTIGFGNESVISGNIDLTNFTANGGQATLGTRDSASLTGLITPSATSSQYRFRSSGTLFLEGTNPLSGSRSVHSSSLSNATTPGMLVLRQSVANTYTGGTYVDGAGLALDSAGALSASTVIHLSNGGYIGATDTSGLTVPNLVSKVGSITNGGVIGIDTTAGINGGFQNYTYASPVDFSSLTSNPYLGTSSQTVTFSGTLTTANSNTGDYFLTGYGTGYLVLSSQLTGSKALHVGVAEGRNGTVELTHTGNTYTGGTVLNAGNLIVSSAGSLGTGAITSTPFDGSGPVYLEGPSNSTLANNIILNPGTLSLYWSFSTFTGAITGTGGLSVLSDLTLSAANSYAGGTELNGIQVTAGSNSALGTGSLSLYDGAHVFFNTAAPQIGSLLSGSTYYNNDDGVTEFASALKFAISGNATLTINQAEDGTFEGFLSQGTGTGSLVKNGSGALTIGGYVGEDDSPPTPYSGGTTINGGMLIAGSATALGTGTITINGGMLGTTQDVVLSNAIAFGANGGTLAGNGTFSTPITVGTNVALAPGASPGILTFTAGLTLAPGGTLDVEIQSAAGLAGTGYDLVNVSTGLLNITASAGSPFTITLTSLDFVGNPGAVYDFSAGTGYSWMLFQGNATSGINGFDPSKFTLDAGAFTNSLNSGVFWLSQGLNGSNPALFLNFSPVPEPSTYALLAAGLAPLLLGLRRRRRN